MRPIDELLSGAYGETVPAEVRAYFEGRFQTATERRRAVARIERDAGEAWEAERRRLAEIAELEAERARHSPKYQALKAKLAGPQLRIEPVELGGMLADLAGYERVMGDLQTAIDSLLATEETGAKAHYRLRDIATAIERFPALGLIEVPESLVDYLPDHLQARVDKDAWRRAAERQELERIEREELAALRAEAEEAEAAALAARLASIEAASIEELLTEAFPDVYERAAVRGLFLTIPPADIYRGQVSLEARFNLLRTSRPADDPERIIIERLRDALSRGERIDTPPASDEVCLMRAFF